MIISKILIDSNIYYHLHAEQTITGTFNEGRDLGVLEREITHSTFDKVIKDFKKYNAKKYNLILNFQSSEGVQSNSNKRIKELLIWSKNLIFINIKNEVLDSLDIANVFNNPNNIINSDGYEVFYLSENYSTNLKTETTVIFEEEFLKKLKIKYLDSKEEKAMHHDSSSVYIPKYINVKKFISLDKEFFIYAIYHLALKTQIHWQEEFKNDETFNSNLRPILICQNLNSSFIASILSSLLKADILILDQIGPINKIYSTLDRKIEEGKNYIVVSDLVCLGTEVKIAKSLIEFLGGNYLGSTSIIRIQTVKKEHKGLENTECVFTVTKENNKEIGYEIKTALDF